MKELIKYRWKYKSQNGEDGVLDEIFKRLGIEKGWFCDVGAWDGVHLSNTYKLLVEGWSGVDIEINEGRYNALVKTAEGFGGRLIPIHRRVSLKRDDLNSSPKAEGLQSILKHTRTPKDFDLLNIDIDSYDLSLWDKFKGYKPKVVVIETNGTKESFNIAVSVGDNKGYKLVCQLGNCFFVKKELIPALNLPEEDLDPNVHYQTSEEIVTMYRATAKIKELSKKFNIERPKNGERVST